MNKQRFSQLVRHYGEIQNDDRIKLHELVKNYPYSQIIHTLIAKANADAKTDVAKQTLNYAALYTSDRSVLKEIIESTNKVISEITSEQTDTVTEQEKEVVEAKVELVADNQEESATSEATPSIESSPEVNEEKHRKVSLDPSLFSQNDIDGLRQEIWEDLKQLEINRSNYLSIAGEESVKEKKKTTTRKPRTTTSKTAKTSAKTTSTSKAKKTTASKTSDTPVKRSARKTSSSSTTKTSTGKAKTTSTTKAKTTKSKAATVKKKPTISEQQKIISKFIDKEPRIKAAKDDKSAMVDQKDLAEPSTEFGEDLVSENLAKILAGQGKNSKAIDIYKKLIWKFPQKKSYFAALIQDLKK